MKVEHAGNSQFYNPKLAHIFVGKITMSVDREYTLPSEVTVCQDQTGHNKTLEYTDSCRLEVLTNLMNAVEDCHKGGGGAPVCEVVVCLG